MSSPSTKFQLYRLPPLPEGCFGTLCQDGVPFAVTLERTYPLCPERPSGIQLLKVLAGDYRCVRTMFNRGGYETYEITGVVGHSRILFHRGNVETDSEGCVLVAKAYGQLRKLPAVVDSRGGFAEFMRRAGGMPELRLEIRQLLA